MAIKIDTAAFEEQHGRAPHAESGGRFTFTAQEENWSFTGCGPYGDLAKAARRAFCMAFKTKFGRIDLAI